MSSPPSTLPGPRKNVEFVGYGEFVDRQLGKVKKQVQAGELLAAVLGWTVAVSLPLLAFVIWDHWISDIGIAGRLAWSLLWLALAGWLLVRWVAPPVRRRVNPAYAAKVVEEAEPQLKNGLINLVFLRARAEPSNEVVLREMEQQTATQLVSIPIDSALDRSSLIAWVSGMAALIVFLVAYAVFSPKSTLDSVWRLMAPWSHTPRPSRVQITDVRPGNTKVYHGRSLPVTARVQNLRADESVTIVYSSADRQAIDRSLSMDRGQEASEFTAQLPADSAGVSSDLTYRVLAGDAAAGPFHVTVLALPSAVVERIRYEFPPYTRQEPVETERVGDIEALEGTKVTWSIRTNDEIDQAFLEFDPVEGEEATLDQRWPLESNGRQATGHYTLTLMPDHRTPTHGSYQVRFRNVAGALNPDPVVHRIDVQPDLSPVVEILQPGTRDIQIPVHGQVEIEVRALDPDFALSLVQLVGLSHGRQTLQAPMVTEPTAGQVVRPFVLRPKDVGLVANDVLVFWAEAHDTRHDPVSGQPAANIARTIQYRLTVMPEEESGPSSEPAEETNKNGSQDDGQPKESPDSAGGKAGTEPGDAASEGDQESRNDSASPDEQGQEGEKAGTESESQQSQDTSGGSDEDGSRAGEGKSDPTEGDPSQGMPTDSSVPADSPERAGGEADGQQKSAEQPQDGAEGNSSQGRGSTGQSSRSDRPPRDGDQELSSEPSLPSDGSRDGDAFERILDQMNRDAKSDRKSGDEGSAAEQQQSPDQTGDSRSDTDGASEKSSDSRGAGSPKAGSNSGAQPQSDPSQGQDRNGRSEPGSAEAEQAADRPTAPEHGEPRRSEPDSRNQSKDGSDPERSDSRRDPEHEAAREAGSTDENADGESQSDADRKPDDGSDRKDAASGSSPDDRGGTGGEPKGRSPQNGEDGQVGTEEKNGTTENRAGENGTSENRAGENGAGEKSPAENDGEQSAAETEAGKEAAPDASERINPAGQDGEPSHSQDGVPSMPTTRPGADAPPNQNIPSGGHAVGRSDSDEETDALDREDEANLEYARKATDLVLDYLEDQASDPDRQLLDRLGWTKDQLQQFLTRWQQMRAAADEPEALGKQRELDEMLRGLGLVPPQDRLRAQRRREMRIEGIREEGRRSEPPAPYRERYRAYLKSRQGSSRPADE